MDSFRNRCGIRTALYADPEARPRRVCGECMSRIQQARIAAAQDAAQARHERQTKRPKETV